MKTSHSKYISELLNVESGNLKKLNSIVLEAVKEEDLILERITKESEQHLTKGQRISDKVAKFGGSWKFIIIFSVVLGLWITVNAFLPAGRRFDAFPFILMNLILSCVAALQAPVIMMSQNRQQEKDREQSVNDYMINLKAEIEIRTLHQKMDLLIQEQFQKLIESQAEQIKLLQEIIGKSKPSAK